MQSILAPRLTATRSAGATSSATARSTRRLKGRPYVVAFLYVNCKDVCPLIGIELKQALAQLGALGKYVTMLAVSADARGDTRAAVGRWLSKLRMPANVRYLIGTDQPLQPVWRSHYAAPQPRSPAVPQQRAHRQYLADRPPRRLAHQVLRRRARPAG